MVFSGTSSSISQLSWEKLWITEKQLSGGDEMLAQGENRSLWVWHIQRSCTQKCGQRTTYFCNVIYATCRCSFIACWVGSRSYSTKNKWLTSSANFQPINSGCRPRLTILSSGAHSYPHRRQSGPMAWIGPPLSRLSISNTTWSASSWPKHAPYKSGSCIDPMRRRGMLKSKSQAVT